MIDRLVMGETVNSIVFDYCPVGIIVTNDEGKLSEVNPALTKITGFSSGELLGLSLNELFGRESHEILRELYGLKMNEKTFTRELPLVCKSLLRKNIFIEGVKVSDDFYTLFISDVHAYQVSRDHEKGETGYISAMQKNIEELKETENALRESQKKLSQAQQIAQLGHWTLDVGAKRVTGSEEIFKQLPISKEGNNLEELSSCIHKEDRENAMALVERGILFGESWNTEYRVIRNDGKEVWLQSIGEATRDSQGNVYELSGTFQDITRRKKTEKMLIQTNEELEMFFYRTSHDLKSPLASSKGLINLARASQNPEEVKYYLDFIAKAIDKLDNILTDLIEVTRVRRGELEYNEVNICQAIDSVCESYPEFENGEIILRKKIEVHSLMTDKSYLNIILRNLISNAVKYRSKTNKANISFTVLKEKSSVDIIVGDNGIGIRDTVLKDIFEMFFRGTDEQETGAGLGLFIVKNAVEKLKGKINVQSNWGLGTTFTISLPILKD